jgi:ribonucleotide reductase alpha subunit
MTELIYLNDDLDSVINRILHDKELSNSGLTKEKVVKTLESFQGDEIACSVFYKKYALKDNDDKIIELTLNESKDRWANAIVGAEIFEAKKDFDYFRELYDYMLPAGRQMYALGNNFVPKATYTNCYVLGIDDDSIEGIFETAKNMAKTYSYGGGVGICIGNLRPKGARVSNSAKYSTGAVSFMELFSNTTGVIGQSARRGALLISIPVDHPDIEDFIEIKHNNIEKVKHANISVKITDDFMKAVVEDKDFDLTFITKHEEIKKTVKAKDLWNKIIKSAHNSAEPGVLFWTRAQEMSPSDTYDDLKINTTNPCLTGDTLVYVADGRGNVSIKQLAEEGVDVPVFCINDKGRPTVRTMRNPRITGYNQPIYNIILDDGSKIKTTENHQFLLRDGEYKETKNLKPGDSLRVFTRYEASIKEIFPKANSRSQDYFWISDGNFTSNIAEHRSIAEFHNNIKLKHGSGYIIHHKDYNGKNNNPLNLEIMRKEDHDKLHAQDMIGDLNPMRRALREWTEEDWKRYHDNMSIAVSGDKNGRWDGITNAQLKEHAIILTKKMGYRFSQKDWMSYARENGITEQFSKWRNDHFCGLRGLAKWAAIECGFENIDLDPRTQRFFLELTNQGYNCIIEEKRVKILKKCEVCGKEFKIHPRYREIGVCSRQCTDSKKTNIKKESCVYNNKTKRKNKNKNNNKEENKLLFENKKKENANKQISIFLNLKLRLGRDPYFKEFMNECKKENISYKFKTTTFFRYFSELKEYSSYYNHKVVSVEFCGFDTVYNGTVDEFHNFCVGGFESKTKSGKNKWTYLLNLQCGEQLLEGGNGNKLSGNCNLSSILLTNFVEDEFTENAKFDFELFKDIVSRGVRHLDNIIELNDGRHALEGQNKAAKLGRRLGLGFTGLADTFAALGFSYDSEEALKLTEEVMKIKMEAEYNASIDLAIERGSFPLYDADKHFERGFCKYLPEYIKERAKKYGLRNVAISTVAPSGSISIMAQCSSGIEPIFALKYKRYTQLGGNERKEFTIYHQALARYFSINNTKDVPDYWKASHQIDYNYRIKLQGLLQKYIDASISSTINLSADVSVETVGQIYIDAWREGLKGITVYREGSREGILVTDEFAKKAGVPEMDSVTYRVKAEGGDKFYIIVSYKNKNIKDPYQVFVMNYKQSDQDTFVRIGNSLVKMLKTKGVSEERITKYSNRSKTSLEKLTRFLSLSMKTNCLAEAVEILNEHAFVGTLAMQLYDIFSKSIDAKKGLCKNPDCKSANVRMEEGCMHCLDCGWSGCG